MAPAGLMNVIAVMRSSASGAALRSACAGVNGARVNLHLGTLAEVMGEIPAVRDPDVLLVEVDPRDAGEMARLQSILRARFPAVPVVATAAEASLQDIRQLMRLGVVDFVPQPIQRTDLAGALDYAASVRQGAREPGPALGQTIGFMKAGGGVGATTLAVQSACALAARAKPSGRSVCLLDLDVQFGAAALYLDLDDRVGLTDLLEAPERLDGELLRSVMGRHDSGLDVLAAPREVVALDSLTPEFVAGCLDLARRAYATVVVDLPMAWTPWSHNAVQCCDLVVLVTQLTVAGIRQAKRQLETMQAHGLQDVPVRLALNRYRKGWGRSARLKEAERALGRRFDHFVPSDFKIVSEAINQGVPLSRVRKRSKVEIGVHELLDGLARALAGGRDAGAAPRLATGRG
ncbi:MAG: CpaE family protein [Kiloniellaceae bacterium]